MMPMHLEQTYAYKSEKVVKSKVAAKIVMVG